MNLGRLVPGTELVGEMSIYIDRCMDMYVMYQSYNMYIHNILSCIIMYHISSMMCILNIENIIYTYIYDACHTNIPIITTCHYHDSCVVCDPSQPGISLG